MTNEWPVLGDLSAEEFLRDYWQKRPLLIRQALAGFHSPISAEELAGLACEEEVESRLLLERGGSHPWELRRGPFDEDDFSILPASHWTLLVQEMNKHLPEAARVMDEFRFIPDWRIDDVMVSYAPEQGSVGPHVDSYDVFLLQAEGQRRWRISRHFDPRLLPDPELGILAEFRAEEEWVLEPGDMLYLPPHVAHHGVALSPGQTWSIGFRSPTAGEMFSALGDYCIDHLARQPAYADPGLTTQTNPGELSVSALRDLKRYWRDLQAGLDLDECLGRMLTEHKGGAGPEPAEPAWSMPELDAALASTEWVWRDSRGHFLFIDDHQGGCMLFVNGEAFALPAADRELAAQLCGQRRLAAQTLRRSLSDAHRGQLLLGLFNQGDLLLDDDED